MISSSSSWITSVSCSLNESGPSVIIIQWLRFIFLAPCPQRVVLSAVDVIFLLVLFIFAVQKLVSRFRNGGTEKVNGSAIHEPLIAKSITTVTTNLRFKLSVLVVVVLTVCAVVSSVLAFTNGNQTTWKLIDGFSWLIQALCFFVVLVLILHEKRFQAVNHPVSVRVFLIVNFVIIALSASSGVVRLSSGTGNTSDFKSDDVISLISLPFSVFLLIVSITGLKKH
ncbi:ABC transporter C family member 14-like [Bidens hawaiensis]|uniref:ABC transporter C family member 14-like n=1 Tax=Bidens hawaiensis TaxID=980011 RepID=UPI00404B180F